MMLNEKQVSFVCFEFSKHRFASEQTPVVESTTSQDDGVVCENFPLLTRKKGLTFHRGGDKTN